MVDFEKIHSLCPRPSSFWTTGLNSFMIHDHDSTSIPETDGKGVVVGKKSDLQSMDYLWTKWILFTVGNVDREISVDIAVDPRSIVGRHSVDTRSTVGRYSGR